MDLRLLRRDAGHLSDLRLPLPALPPKRLVVGLKQAASLGRSTFRPWLRAALERLERQLPMGLSDRTGEKVTHAPYACPRVCCTDGSERPDPGCGWRVRAPPKGTPRITHENCRSRE